MCKFKVGDVVKIDNLTLKLKHSYGLGLLPDYFQQEKEGEIIYMPSEESVSVSFGEVSQILFPENLCLVKQAEPEPKKRVFKYNVGDKVRIIETDKSFLPPEFKGKKAVIIEKKENGYNYYISVKKYDDPVFTWGCQEESLEPWTRKPLKVGDRVRIVNAEGSPCIQVMESEIGKSGVVIC
jgi:hypothetical protein